MSAAIAALAVIAALIAAERLSRRRIVDDSQPTEADRLAAWERRRGEYRAQQRLREHRARLAFDARASVSPKITPRLP